MFAHNMEFLLIKKELFWLPSDCYKVIAKVEEDHGCPHLQQICAEIRKGMFDMIKKEKVSLLKAYSLAHGKTSYGRYACTCGQKTCSKKGCYSKLWMP